MSKGLFFVMPFHGHVIPTLPVAQALVSRGDSIIYYVADEFQETVERTGAVFRSIRLTDEEWCPPSFQPNEDLIAPPGPIMELVAFQGLDTDPAHANIGIHMHDNSSQVLRHLLESASSEQADYVVYDIWCHWGCLLAQILNLPTIVLHTTYVDNASMETLQVLAMESIKQDLAVLFDAPESRSNKLINQYREYSYRADGNNVSAKPLNISLIPRTFQPDDRSFDADTVFVGPTIAPRTYELDFPIQQLHPDTTLYISLGTMLNNHPEFYHVCFEAFANTSWQVVMAVGQNVDLERLGSIPANFLVQRWVPQLEVLHLAKVFVTHGGMNSIMEALSYGVPLVVFPQQPEQVTNGARVVELGLGLMIENATMTVPHLREAVSRVASDPSFRAKARQMQRELQAAGGATQAVDAIFEYMQQQRLSTRLSDTHALSGSDTR